MSETIAAVAPVRVAAVEAVPVRVRRRPELLPKTAHGAVTCSDYVLLRLTTEDGVVGLGEVTCEPRWNGEEWSGTTTLVRDRLAELLVGADLRSWAAIAATLDGTVRERPFLRAGVEMACLDALGRTVGLPVTALLGGALRDAVPTRIVLPARAPDAVAAMARTAVERGARALKVKVGIEPSQDVARVAAVREAVGDAIALTVDANEGWTAADARAVIGQLEALGVLAVEQPLPRHPWRPSADLRARTALAIVADEAVWSRRDVLDAAAAGAYDVVSLYPGKCGGLTDTVQLARLAHGLGLGLAIGSNLELGVAAAAQVHVAACAPALAARVPADVIGPLYFEHPLVTDASFVGWDGAAVPAGPGLGVDLDEAAVAACRLDGSGG